jgi:hypothetical protein
MPEHTATRRGRKPSHRKIEGPEARLWAWLRDRGRPDTGLGTVSISTLSNSIVADDLGVSDRTVRLWAAKLRAAGLLSVLTYARAPRGLRGGCWKVWIAHEPGAVAAVRQRVADGAWLTIRGETRRAREYRAAWASEVALEAVRKSDLGRCRTTSPQLPEGERGENENPQEGRASDEVREDLLALAELGLSDPREVDPSRRRLRNERGRRVAGCWLARLGLRGRGFRAARGWVWRLFERLRCWRRTLRTVWALVLRAATKRAPAGWHLQTLRNGFDRFADEGGRLPLLRRAREGYSRTRRARESATARATRRDRDARRAEVEERATVAALGEILARLT